MVWTCLNVLSHCNLLGTCKSSFFPTVKLLFTGKLRHSNTLDGKIPTRAKFVIIIALRTIPVQSTNHITSFTCSYAIEHNYSLFAAVSKLEKPEDCAIYIILAQLVVLFGSLQTFVRSTVTRRLSSIVESKLFCIERQGLNKMVFVAALLVGVMSVGAVVTMAVSGSVHMLKTVEKDNRRAQDLIKSRTTPHNQYQAVY